MNGDGKLDVVVVNQDQNNVAVLLGNGDGTFQAPVIYQLTAGVPGGVTVADFNGDKKPDVAVVQESINGYVSDVVILLNKGDGTLGQPKAYGPASSGFTITSGDIDGDGKMDLLVGGNGSLTLFYGNGDGSFQTPIYLNDPEQGETMESGAAADLNGDGRLDIVGAQDGSVQLHAGIVVFLQNPDGSFAPGQNYDLPNGVYPGYAVAIGDLNGDGKLDVVLSLGNGQAYAYLGNGDGTFQAPLKSLSGSGGNDVVLADFNHDGVLDAAFADYSGSGVLASPGIGNGKFSLGGSLNLTTAGGTTSLAVGDFNRDGWADIVTADSTGDKVTVFLNTPQPQQFVNVTPCRLVDTRKASGGNGPIQGGTFEAFNLPQIASGKSCADLSAASAYSLNVTVVPPGPLGYLTIWPTGGPRSNVSTMNSLDGRVKANAAIVPAGAGGGVNVFVSDTSDVVLDIDGYFAPAGQSTLAFYPLPPCRVADTRKNNFPQGLGAPSLQGGVARGFPILNTTCPGIPNSVQGYSFNFTVVPKNGQPLGYLTVWPTGETQPVVSTLNAPTGTVVANAGIVPAGTGGDIEGFASNDTDLIIDINGYFDTPGANGLSLYPTAPCRVIDTRKVGNGQPFMGELTVNVAGSICAPPSTAQAYVFNATVVPSGSLGYLTLWPDGGSQPLVSTLNALDGAITSNMAIVPNSDGSTDAYASDLTQLILDISSYFAP